MNSLHQQVNYLARPESDRDAEPWWLKEEREGIVEDLIKHYFPSNLAPSPRSNG